MRFERLRLGAEMLSGNPEFRAYLNDALAVADRLSILDQLEERRNDLGCDLLLFVRPDGRLVARTDRPEAVDLELGERPLFQKARTDFEAQGLWAEADRLYEAVAVPVSLGGSLLGYLAMGFRIGDLQALELQRATGTQVVFLAKTGAGVVPVGSTLDSRQREEVLGLLRGKGDLLPQVVYRGETVAGIEVVAGSERYLALLLPLRGAGDEPMGALLALASLERELAPFRFVRQVLVGSAFGAVFVAVLLSWWLARRTGGPFRDLAQAVRRVGAGDLEVALPKAGPPELVRLAEAFERLLASLKEQRELAEYVQKLARTLPEAPGGGQVARPTSFGKPETTRVALLGLELRRYARARVAADPAASLERLGRDVQKIAAIALECGGRLERVAGFRVLASFGGEDRAERALAAASEMVAAIAVRENAFDEAEPPAAALVVGELVRGPVKWGTASENVVIGLALQQLEALLREAQSGDIVLSQAVHAELASRLERVGLEAQAQRGLLSTQALFVLPAEASAKALGIDVEGLGRRLAQGTLQRTQATLTAIGPGSVLGGRFEIEKTLGSGGMGIVFKARDHEIGDVVALKMLKPEVAGDQKLVERLKTELRLARKVVHPNVLRLFDFGELDGVPYISMEYVRGIPLRELLERSGRLPPAAALRLLRQLASGLAAAHAEGILHRDIKPENIILDAAGNAKLMDFGLARPVQRIEAGQTQAGWLVGTPHYMAPEQIQGQEAVPASDVYACGVVAYEVFLGKLPFVGDNPMEVLLAHLNQPPREPKELWPEIPEPLRNLILRCLEKNPAARPASGRELLAELERL
jgi:serine/threonine-protein kinase